MHVLSTKIPVWICGTTAGCKCLLMPKLCPISPQIAKWRTFRIHRLGSDYRSNYYEYEIPLTLTPHGEYNGSTVAGCLAVWPKDNNLDIDLSVLTNVKKARNRLKNISNSGISYAKVYSEYDPDKPSQ